MSTSRILNYTFTPGWHNVCVAIQADSNCTAQYCDSIFYQPNADTCNLNGYFTWKRDSLDPKKITFTASPNQSGLSYNWKFGDNTTGSGRIVTHNYSLPIIYSVLLVVTDTLNSCKDSVRQNVSSGASQDSCTVFFTYTINQQGQVSFTAISNQYIVSQRWYIAPLPDSANNSVFINRHHPDYILPGPGVYYVCLTLNTGWGCGKTYCDSIVYNVADSTVTTGRIAVIPSYPNPVQTESSIRFNLNLESSSMISYKVNSLSGNVVFQSQQQGQQGVNTINIPVQHLGRGQYFIDIMYGNTKKRSVFQKL